MFSGIVEELGQVKGTSKKGNLVFLEIISDIAIEGIKLGDSIAVNGVCLTVVQAQQKVLGFEVMQETFSLTNLGSLRIGDKVNLERSLKMGDRVSGHFVLGHVDCQGIIRKKSFVNSNLCFQVSVPAEFAAYVVQKGCIAIDGISLTIADKKAGGIEVYVIPHTLKNTTLGFKGPSDKVNLEFDILLKKTALNPSINH